MSIKESVPPLVLFALVTVSGCYQVTPRSIPGESDTQTELASGHISREDAIQFAYAAMSMEREKDDPRYLRAFLMDGKWLISNSYALGGGWIVTINGRSGEVGEKRRLPAR